MAVAGGLVSEKKLPQSKLHEGYEEVGEGMWTAKRDGMEVVGRADIKAVPPDGHALIQVEVGRDTWDNFPVPVTVDTHTLLIPRGFPVIVPIAHVNVLSDAIETKYFQPSLQRPLQAKHGRVYNYRIIRLPKGLKKSIEEDTMLRHEVIEIDQ